jgi:hypothetical protein
MNSRTIFFVRGRFTVAVFSGVEIERHLHRARARTHSYDDPAILVWRQHETDGHRGPDRHCNQSKRHQQPKRP